MIRKWFGCQKKNVDTNQRQVCRQGGKKRKYIKKNVGLCVIGALVGLMGYGLISKFGMISPLIVEAKEKTEVIEELKTNEDELKKDTIIFNNQEIKLQEDGTFIPPKTIKYKEQKSDSKIIKGFASLTNFNGYYRQLSVLEDEKEKFLNGLSHEMKIEVVLEDDVKTNLEFDWECNHDFLKTDYLTYTFTAKPKDGFSYEKNFMDFIKRGQIPEIQIKVNIITKQQQQFDKIKSEIGIETYGHNPFPSQNVSGNTYYIPRYWCVWDGNYLEFLVYSTVSTSRSPYVVIYRTTANTNDWHALNRGSWERAGQHYNWGIGIPNKGNGGWNLHLYFHTGYQQVPINSIDNFGYGFGAVSYNGNGAQSGSIGKDSVPFGWVHSVSKNAYSRTGYTFTGWATQANGGGTKYQPGNEFRPFLNNVTLYAQWTQNKYKLDLNGTLDGTRIWGLQDVATVDIYVNGSLVANDVSDYGGSHPYGAKWEIKDIKCKPGYRHTGGTLTGTIGGNVDINPTFEKIKYTLDVNSYVDGGAVNSNIPAVFDVYINGTLVANDVNDYYNDKLTYGTKWEIKDIRANAGYETYDAQTSGTIVSNKDARIWIQKKESVTYDPQGGTMPPVASNPNNYKIIEDGYYSIQSSIDSGKYIHVYSMQLTDGTGLVIYSGGGTAPQTLWYFQRYKDTPYYYIINKLNGKAMDIDGNAKVDPLLGRKLELWQHYDGTEDPDFLWGLIDQGNGQVSIVNKHTGQVIDLKGADTTNANVIQQYNLNNSSAQKWKLVPKEVGPYQKQKKVVTSQFRLSSAVPQKNGAVFKCWNTKKNGTGTNYAPGDIYNKAGETTVYAQWNELHSITVDPNGGTYKGTSEPTVLKGASGELLELNDLPTRQGYIFKGWKYEGAGSLQSGNHVYMLEEAVPMFTIADKTDSDGTKYTNYAIDFTNTSTGYRYPTVGFFTYPFTVGHTYKVSADVRVNSISGIDWAHMRHAAIHNDYESKNGLVTWGMDKLTNGWEHKEVSRTFTSSTITQAGTTHNINPRVEFYSRISSGNRGQLNFDIKNITVYDVTTGKYVTSKSDKAKNGATVHVGNGSGKATAVWEETACTITYKANGGDGADVSQEVDYGQPWTTKGSIFTKQGYRLTGWNTEKNGSGKAYELDTRVDTITENLTLYAQWTANTYTIHYDGNGNTFNKPGDVQQMEDSHHTYDVAKNLTENQYTRIGFAFMGWNTEKNGTGTPYKDGQSVINLTDVHDDTVTLYAQWEPLDFMVVFHPNGGTPPQPFSQKEGEQGQPIGELPTTTRKGYTFLGWYDTETLTEDSGKATENTVIITKLTELWAQWEKDTYSISYDYAGGNVPDNPESYSVDTPTITLKNPTREGYIFTGWTGSNGDVPQTTVTIPKGSTGDKSYVAHWKPITYTIRYDGNGATSGSMNDSVHTYDVAKALSRNQYVRKNAKFIGWNTEADGSGDSFDDEQSVDNLTTKQGAVISLYAQWEKTKVVVHFDSQGGSKVADINGYVGDPIGTLETPTREGYTFDGWWTHPGTGSPINEQTVLPADETTYYAHWVANGYEIQYDLDGGKVSGNPNTYKPTDKDITLINPTKVGYTFVGWVGTDVSNPSKHVVIPTGSMGNRRYEAIWQAHTYTIAYHGNGNDAGSMTNSQHTYDVAKNLTKNQYTRTGYDFVGWNTRADGHGTAYKNSQSVKNLTATDQETVSLYAQWKVKQYKVTFDPNMDASSNTVTVYAGTRVQEMRRPNGATYREATGGTKTKYILTFHEADPQKGLISVHIKGLFPAFDGSIRKVESTKTSIVDFDPTTVTKVVQFDANGGTCDVESARFTVNTPLTTLPTPVREGYRFDGWYTSPDGGNKVTTSTPLGNKNITLYAHWTAKTYTVTYRGNNGAMDDGTESFSEDVVWGSQYAISSNPFHRDGYTFKGWNTKSDGTGKDYTYRIDKSEPWKEDRNVTLYAIWTRN